MSEMISILAWTKLHGINYSTGNKMVRDGLIPGAVVSGSRTLVPADSKPPEREKIACSVCGEMLTQITASHLRRHSLTMAGYMQQFPGAPIVSEEVRIKNSDAIQGIVRSEETRMNVSKGRTGIRPQNHPRYIIGNYTASVETREKMAQSQTGRTHSDETKKKIGDGNRGKVMSLEAIEKIRAANKANFEANGSPLKGRKMPAEFRAIMRAAAAIREASYTPEKKAETAAARSAGLKGIKRTPEQKQRYREARVKWMRDNPLLMKDTAGERAVKTWLEEQGLAYEQQFVIDGHLHPYDFFVPEKNTIIEFDGTHHWAFFWFGISGKTQDEIGQMLVDQQIKDAEENWIAGQAGHRIVRIYGYAAPGDSEHGTLEEQLRLQGFPFD